METTHRSESFIFILEIGYIGNRPDFQHLNDRFGSRALPLMSLISSVSSASLEPSACVSHRQCSKVPKNRALWLKYLTLHPVHTVSAQTGIMTYCIDL